MEKLKEIHDWMSKEDGLTTPFDQFAARFKDNPAEQKGLYDYLKGKDSDRYQALIGALGLRR